MKAGVLFASTVKEWVLTCIHGNVIQSNLFNICTKGTIESVHINRLTVFSRLNLEKV